LGLEDAFPFACKECGECCKNRHDLLLTAYDVFRLARHFGCLTGDIIEKYCEIYPGQDSKLPVVRVIPRIYDESCPFLRKGKCSLHYTNAKPVLCRAFPLAKINKGGGECGYYLNSTDCGIDGGVSIVRDWVGDVASAESDAASDAWTAAIFKIIPIMHKLSEAKSQDEFQWIFQTAFAFLYLMYDTSQDFAEQCAKNAEIFIEGSGAYKSPV